VIVMGKCVYFLYGPCFDPIVYQATNGKSHVINQFFILTPKNMFATDNYNLFICYLFLIRLKIQHFY